MVRYYIITGFKQEWAFRSEALGLPVSGWCHKKFKSREAAREERSHTVGCVVQVTLNHDGSLFSFKRNP